jgi:uncharacterized protein (TIGR03083 family)
MADLGTVYDETREEISTLVTELATPLLDRPVPATPEWTIKDVVAHLTGDVTCVLRGDFPREYFASIGEEDAVAVLNRWTAGQVAERRERPLFDILLEWKDTSQELVAMMNEEKPWPEGVPPFAAYILVVDIGVHQQDIFGTLGIEKNRDGAAVRIGLRTYTVGMDMRLRTAGPGAGTLSLDTGDKTYTVGDGAPVATVRAPRFEFFRALAGRRSPEQIASYEWDGDSAPFIPYFYPYGIRQNPLNE